MTFDELNLNKPVLNALNDLGYTHPTTIQERAFPVIMSGRDVVGIAQTGTGKTFAYLLPCLRQWKFSKERLTQVLILVPTRELVVQVVEEVKKLSAYTNAAVTGIYGEANIQTQIAAVSDGVDILVATPGRLIDLVMKRAVKLKTIKKLVIDEVDEMLNLGFRTQLKLILDLLALKRQNIMFSATMTDDVEILIQNFFNRPVKIEAAATGTPLDKIIQTGYEVPNFYTKVNLLTLLLNKDSEMSKVLVFTATKKLADELYEQTQANFPGQSGVIHSNKSQNTRFDTLNKFQQGHYRILIATDIVSRGLDISKVTHVINFDTPEVPEDYMHRIGRTGRAEKDGIAITFIAPKDAERQAKIEALMNCKIPIAALPGDLIISELLTEDEMPKVYMPNMELKAPPKAPTGPAFHEKSEKNKKVPNKIRHAEKMRMKYRKPKTRGQKLKKGR